MFLKSGENRPPLFGTHLFLNITGVQRKLDLATKVSSVFLLLSFPVMLTKSCPAYPCCLLFTHWVSGSHPCLLHVENLVPTHALFLLFEYVVPGIEIVKNLTNLTPFGLIELPLFGVTMLDCGSPINYLLSIFVLLIFFCFFWRMELRTRSHWRLLLHNQNIDLQEKIARVRVLVL